MINTRAPDGANNDHPDSNEPWHKVCHSVQPLNPKLPNYSSSSDPLTLGPLMITMMIMNDADNEQWWEFPPGPPVCSIRRAVPVSKRVPRTVQQIQRERENYQEAYSDRGQHRGGQIEFKK